ncbi:MAG: MFS transporter, partial [Acidobacteriia bacterium]|nr:MFS transporter [Terriglobia bacterium]
VADLFRPGLRKPFVVAVSLAVLQQVTGINTILYYGSILLKEHAGQETSAAIGANVLVGLVNLVCTIAAMFVIDRVGRRPLLVAGAAGMGLSLAGLGLAFRRDPLPVNLLLALILAYVACFATSMGPGVWVYISELFPTAIRGRAVSAATVCLWAACLLVTLTFLTLVQWLTPAGAFWIYAGLCAATVAFVWRAAPETSGKSLEEIQRLWTRDQPSCKS